MLAMHHSVHRIIEALYAAKRCPRLHINAMYQGVECPDFVRKKWRERLVVDLDANYPLNLSFGREGIATDLSFGGHVSRCVFPWDAIYVVSDRATGRGMTFEENIPTSSQENLLTMQQVEQKSRLQAVDSATVKEPPEVTQATPDDKNQENQDEDNAKKRRAAFRVIEGGG